MMWIEYIPGQFGYRSQNVVASGDTWDEAIEKLAHKIRSGRKP